MSKALSVATLMAVVFSWLAVSCSGPVFIHPPAAAASMSAAVPASATIAGTGVATKTPVAATSPWTGSGFYLMGILLMAITLGFSMFIFRTKPESA